MVQLAFHLEVDPAYATIPGATATNGNNTAAAEDRQMGTLQPGAGNLPNDAAEQDRLNLQHRVITMLLDNHLGFAPPATASPSPRNVLDVATGTGIWAVEYAKLHPESHVVGSDIELYQPTEGNPPNCRFVRGDAENEPWPFARELFDYIHLRFMVSCFGSVDAVLGQIYSHLAPGGWVEFQDTMGEALSPDGTAAGSAVEEFMQGFTEGMRRLGKDTSWIGRLEELLSAKGFEDIQVTVLPSPMGAWAAGDKWKTMGNMSARNLEAALGTGVGLLKAAGWSGKRAEEVAERVRGELREGRVHVVLPLYVVYARKPST